MTTDSNNYIFVVWHESNSGNFEIYYKRSTDTGSTWTTMRLTWNSGDSVAPDIAVDANGRIHVAWGDNTPGNYEMYYKKGIQ
jgi:hypothetical protein